MNYYQDEGLLEAHLKKQVRKYKRSSWIVFSGNIFLFLIIILMAFMLSWTTGISLPLMHGDSIEDYNVTIDFSDLNEDQIKIATKIVRSVKNQYLVKQKSITFTNNLSNYYNSQENEEYEGKLLGFNRLGGRNYVLYRDNEIQLRNTLCHELLHTYLMRDELSHDIVYDLSSYLPCYKTTTVDVVLR